jgi:hypothetical protein
MAEPTPIQASRYRENLVVDQFNRQTGIEIYLLDLDHGGANLETPFPLSPDYHVEFSFFVPEASKPIQVSGRVVWKQQLTVLPTRYHLRVQFYAPRWDLDNLRYLNQPYS